MHGGAVYNVPATAPSGVMASHARPLPARKDRARLPWKSIASVAAEPATRQLGAVTETALNASSASVSMGQPVRASIR